MCGRAGRRGIDSQGNIFLMMGDKKFVPQPLEIISMLKGMGTQVESKFRLSYKTIISFLSRNVKNILEFFKESYLENNKLMIMPQTIKKINELKDDILNMGKIQCLYEEEGEEFIKKYYEDFLIMKETRKILFSVYLNNFF
jgi:superfamily II RNA helicase